MQITISCMAKGLAQFLISLYLYITLPYSRTKKDLAFKTHPIQTGGAEGHFT